MYFPNFYLFNLTFPIFHRNENFQRSHSHSDNQRMNMGYQFKNIWKISFMLNQHLEVMMWHAQTAVPFILGKVWSDNMKEICCWNLIHFESHCCEVRKKIYIYPKLVIKFHFKISELAWMPRFIQICSESYSDLFELSTYKDWMQLLMVFHSIPCCISRRISRQFK